MLNRICNLLVVAGMGTALSACMSPANQRDDTFRQIKPPPRAMLLLVGGNSEFTGCKGLWPIREKIANDFAHHIGLTRDDISTDYVSWTGDSAEDPGRLPGSIEYLDGHVAIAKRLASYGPASSNRLFAVVGWSNGGATAAQLSSYLGEKANTNVVDLLVTLDPVSRITERPCNSRASTWLNVYTKSAGIDKFQLSNIIAWFGGAWNDFPGPELMARMAGNHGDVLQMWENVVLPSAQFKEWASKAKDRLGTTNSPPETLPPNYVKCPE